MYSSFALGAAAISVLWSAASSNAHSLSPRGTTEVTLALTNAILETSSFYSVEIGIGNQTFHMIIDTGSSDFWVLTDDYQCLNVTTNAVIAQAGCELSDNTYSYDSTFNPIPERFALAYGAGIATGWMGYENVTVGNITLSQQEGGFVSKVSGAGDGFSSGVLGLSYPFFTFAMPANVTANSSTAMEEYHISYTPLFYHMFEDGLVDSYFSVALERAAVNATTSLTTVPGGYITFGGLPPISYNSTFAVVELEPSAIIPTNLTDNVSQVTEWIFTVSGVSWGASGSQNLSSNSTSFQTLVDTGNFENALPQEIADEVNAAFNPPAVYDAGTGFYGVSCDAEPPQLGIEIDGQLFWHNATDLVWVLEEGTCVSTIVRAFENFDGLLNVLGATFLKNVVAVFDAGNKEMRFASRTDGTIGNGTSSATTNSSSSGGSSASTYAGAGSKYNVGFVEVATMALVTTGLLLVS